MLARDEAGMEPGSSFPLPLNTRTRINLSIFCECLLTLVPITLSCLYQSRHATPHHLAFGPGENPMSSLVIVSEKSWKKCSCCEEVIRSFEKHTIVCEDGKPLRGERYCDDCVDKGYAHENNPELDAEAESEESGLRSREEYAAYQAAGCPSAYWEDQDAGYTS